MARWKARVEFLLSVIELLFYLLLQLRHYKAKCVKTRCRQEGVGHLEPRFQGGRVVPLPLYWYRSKGNWLRYNFAADSFYIGLMKLCSRLFILYCWNCPKDDKFRYFFWLWSVRWLGFPRSRWTDITLTLFFSLGAPKKSLPQGASDVVTPLWSHSGDHVCPHVYVVSYHGRNGNRGDHGDEYPLVIRKKNEKKTTKSALE